MSRRQPRTGSCFRITGDLPTPLQFAALIARAHTHTHTHTPTHTWPLAPSRIRQSPPPHPSTRWPVPLQKRVWRRCSRQPSTKTHYCLLPLLMESCTSTQARLWQSLNSHHCGPAHSLQVIFLVVSGSSLKGISMEPFLSTQTKRGWARPASLVSLETKGGALDSRSPGEAWRGGASSFSFSSSSSSSFSSSLSLLSLYTLVNVSQSHPEENATGFSSP